MIMLKNNVKQLKCKIICNCNFL